MYVVLSDGYLTQQFNKAFDHQTARLLSQIANGEESTFQVQLVLNLVSTYFAFSETSSEKPTKTECQMMPGASPCFRNILLKGSTCQTESDYKTLEITKEIPRSVSAMAYKRTVKCTQRRQLVFTAIFRAREQQMKQCYRASQNPLLCY